jgi:ABC-2 type transport system permease protein
MLHRILALIIKEVLAAVKDKRARFVLVFPPLIQLFIFAFAATLDVKNVPIAIVNRDTGEKAFEFVQRFHGSPTFSHIIYLQSPLEIADCIDNQRAVMVISIDDQFSKNINAQKSATVQLILDGRKSNTAQIVAGYTSQIIERFNQDIASKVDVTLQSTETITRNWYNPNLLYYWYNVPSLAGILTMLVAFVITSMSVAREREMGTFDQLLVSPLQPIEILLGKAIPAIIISLAEGTIIVLFAIFVFQIPFTGSLAILYFSLFVFVTAIVGIGLFISSLSNTQQQAILGTFVFMSPSVLLSGFATPIENMPTWLQHCTYIIPLRYMLVISKGQFLKAVPFDIVINNIWPMALIGVGTLSAATWLFKRRLG